MTIRGSNFVVKPPTRESKQKVGQKVLMPSPAESAERQVVRQGSAGPQSDSRWRSRFPRSNEASIWFDLKVCGQICWRVATVRIYPINYALMDISARRYEPSFATRQVKSFAGFAGRPNSASLGKPLGYPPPASKRGMNWLKRGNRGETDRTLLCQINE